MAVDQERRSKGLKTDRRQHTLNTGPDLAPGGELREAVRRVEARYMLSLSR